MASLNNHNWLGFSLAPQVKMDVTTNSNHHHHHHEQQHHNEQAHASTSSSTSLPSSVFPVPHLYSSGIYYGGENGFYPFSVMPLKSDGTLCIMEALSRTQQEGMLSVSTPKLEDFLGSVNVGAHQYERNSREEMASTIQNTYFHSNQEIDNDKQQSLNIFPPLKLHTQIQTNPFYQPLQEQICSGISDQEMYHAPPLDGRNRNQIESCDFQNSMKNFFMRNSSSNHGMEQNLASCLSDEGRGSGPAGGFGHGNWQSLSLSMSPGSQTSCVTSSQRVSTVGNDCMALDTKKKGSMKIATKQTVHRKSIETFGQRTSQYRGVTRHRWTGRYEAHLWDNSCKKEGQTRKGRQVYLGGYDMEEKAARAYDLAALKYWGPSTHINFPLENYQEQLEEMQKMSRQEYVAHLRRKSSGFSRGASIYRGVTRHHQHGRWQARIGRVAGNKDLYLGTFSTQEEAAEAYDIAAIKFRGVNAVTNFDITRYDVERIMASNSLLPAEQARRNREIDHDADMVVPPLTNTNNICPKVENNRNSQWKMVQYESQQPCTMEAFDHKPLNIYRSPLPDLYAIDSVSSVVHDSTRLSTHFSNPSSTISLSSSREGSPDKNQTSVVLSKTSLNPWISSSQPRTNGSSIGHIPVFAAWIDA